MIRALNLNHRGLVTERRGLIETLDHDVNDGAPPRRLVQNYLDTGPDGARPSFANVAIGYLMA